MLEGLRRLAYNLWWSWHPHARNLFSRIDAGAWARYRNPVPVLAGAVNWTQLLESAAFMADYEEILREFEAIDADNHPQTSNFFGKIKNFWEGLGA